MQMRFRIPLREAIIWWDQSQNNCSWHRIFADDLAFIIIISAMPSSPDFLTSAARPVAALIKSMPCISVMPCNITATQRCDVPWNCLNSRVLKFGLTRDSDPFLTHSQSSMAVEPKNLGRFLKQSRYLFFWPKNGTQHGSNHCCASYKM